jgi:hypothetical protein
MVLTAAGIFQFRFKLLRKTEKVKELRQAKISQDIIFKGASANRWSSRPWLSPSRAACQSAAVLETSGMRARGTRGTIVNPLTPQDDYKPRLAPTNR